MKKSPSRMLRDKMRHEAFLSRKAGSCERDPPFAADPASSTTKHTDRPGTRRFASPCRRLSTVGAGNEEEWGSWAPGEGVEETFIPQLDGEVSDSRDEENEKDFRDEKEEEEVIEEDEKVLNAIASLNSMLEKHLVFSKPD